MDAKKERLLNDMNTSARKAELGAEMVDFEERIEALEETLGDETAGIVSDVAALETDVGTLETGVAALGKLVTNALVAGDINTGVATVDTGVDFGAWYSVMVTTAAGAPRTITKIEKGGAGNLTKILITATDVAATDIVSVIVK